MYNTEQIEKLASSLVSFISSSKENLFLENVAITQDTDEAISFDYSFTLSYLEKYLENNRSLLSKKLKPKGRVFVILSYNEPIIMSVVPILNALVAGNSVTVKPSKKCHKLFETIWIQSGIKKEFDLNLEVVNLSQNSDVDDYIKKSECVYFFGSHAVAKEIYKICADNFVEFIPEIETADCKVVKREKFDNAFIKKDSIETLKSSFTHAGQICERICGVFVAEDMFADYSRELMEAYNIISKDYHSSLIRKDFVFNQKYLERISQDIQESGATLIAGEIGKTPIILLDPNIECPMVKNGYFYPMLWVSKFKDLDSLISTLNSRTYFLGLHISTDSSSFRDTLVEKTNFTRYTIGDAHDQVGDTEGWGGRWPSGVGGNKSWLEHFTVEYAVVK